MSSDIEIGQRAFRGAGRVARDAGGVELALLLTKWRQSVLAVLVALAAACSPQPSDHVSDSIVGRALAAAQANSRAGTGTAGGADTISATPTQWTVESARAVIAAALGTSVTVAGNADQPFMSLRGTVLRAGEATIQIYVYGDAGARGRDTDVLDTMRVAPPTMMIGWREPPALVVNNNLAAIVLTRDESVRRRIREALSRGHDPSPP